MDALSMSYVLIFTLSVIFQWLHSVLADNTEMREWFHGRIAVKVGVLLQLTGVPVNFHGQNINDQQNR